MAPRGISTWRRPYTSIYNDNYRYGTNLYSGTLSDISKKYTDSMSKTQLRSDRRDLKLSTFADSTIGSSAAGGGDSRPITSPMSPMPSSLARDGTSTYRGSVFESMLNTALHSSYVTDVEDNTGERRTVSRAISEAPQPTGRTSTEPPRPTSLYDDAVFFTSKKVTTTTDPPRPTSLYDDPVMFTPKRVTTTTTTADASETKETDMVRKKRVVREAPSPVAQGTQNGPSPAFWKDKCRDLQFQVDEMTQAMSDMSTKLKGELSNMKAKLHTEMSDMHGSLEQTSQQNSELQKTIKRQANQLIEMQNSYEDLQRHLQDSLDEIAGYQRRSQSLRKEMDRLRMEVEETTERGRV